MTTSYHTAKPRPVQSPTLCCSSILPPHKQQPTGRPRPTPGPPQATSHHPPRLCSAYPHRSTHLHPNHPFHHPPLCHTLPPMHQHGTAAAHLSLRLLPRQDSPRNQVSQTLHRGRRLALRPLLPTHSSPLKSRRSGSQPFRRLPPRQQPSLAPLQPGLLCQS